MRVRHVRAAHDSIGAPALLVLGLALRGLPEYARALVGPRVRSVPLEWGDTLDELLGAVPRCRACAAGAPCKVWDWAALCAEGVTPRDPADVESRADADPEADAACAAAAATLGLSAAQAGDPDAVRAAHKRLAFDAHPDRGGDAAVMVKINAARDTLLPRA